MKKILAIILSAILLLSPVSAAAKSVVVSLSSACGSEGEAVTLALSFRGTGQLSAVCLELKYDQNALSYLSYTKGAGLKAEYCSLVHVADGRLRLTFTDPKEDYGAVGPVVYLKFKIISDTVGAVKVTPLVTEGALFDSGYIELEYTAEAGAVTVLPTLPQTDLEISAGLVYLDKPIKPRELASLLGNGITVNKSGGYVGSCCELSYNGSSFYTVYKGDVNGDSLITTADYLRMQSFLKGAAALSYPSIAACDMDGNGIHNTTDALYLRQILMGDKN